MKDSVFLENMTKGWYVGVPSSTADHRRRDSIHIQYYEALARIHHFNDNIRGQLCEALLTKSGKMQ